MALVDKSPVMDPDEFRRAGYLLEVNRRLLHPLGLALGVHEGQMFVVDARDDPEGIYFDLTDEEWETARSKAAYVHDEFERRADARETALGWIVQPLGASAG